LRGALKALHDDAVVHDASVEVAPNQPQHGLVVDPLRQSILEHVVIDPIEELLQINIHHHPPARLHMTLRLQPRIVRLATRSETVVVHGEARINQWLQDLQQGLLDQTVGHARIPIRDPHPAHRLRPKSTALQFIPYRGPVGLEIVGRLRDG